MKPCHHIFVSIVLLFAIFITQAVLAGDEVFKINKLNLIWSKAKHSLGPSKLKDLKNELVKHELDEISLKKMKVHNQDKEGLFEAATRKKLLLILTKYSLEKYYDDIHPHIDSEHPLKKENLASSKIKESIPVSELKPNFRDKKLDKLWKKAESSHFSQEELMILHEEFQHHQEKLDEHYEFMDQLDDKLSKRSKSNEQLENSIDVDKDFRRKTSATNNLESSSEKKARLESNFHQSLKNKHKDIKSNYDKLNEKIASRKIIETSGPFEEQAINDLWVEAVNANFTSDELDSFKEELGHYEVRLKKLRHFENELERDTLISKQSSSNAEEDDDSKRLKKKVQDLTYKVANTHKALADRIAIHSDEL